jgi:asparagine synthase (glutamine-hydrolysing)
MIHGIFYKKVNSLDYRQAMEAPRSDLVLSSPHQDIICESFTQAWLAQAVDKKIATEPYRLASIGLPPQAVITAWARLDNQEELGKALGFSKHECVTLGAPALILHAWLKWGDACTEYLFGDFCFAIYDIQENRLFCARDQMGVKPFYYHNSNELFVFSSSLSLFHRILNQPIKPRMEWASRYLLNHSLAMDFEKTAYQSIFKLPPAHWCKITVDRMVKTRYFSFHTNKIKLDTSQDYVDYYQRYLDTAVKHRVQVNHPLGSELSGGLDSSSVTAYAIKHYPRPLNDFHTFGFAYFEHEPKQMLRLSQHFGIPMTYICCNISLFDTETTRSLKALGAPLQYDNLVNYEIFYNLAANLGVRTLLSGFGGDEFVTSIHGYLYLNELLKNRQYFQFYRHAPGHSLRRALSVLKQIGMHRNQRGVQHKRMAEAYNKRWPHHVINDELVHAYALKDAWDAEGLFDYGYNNLDQFTLENRLAPFISTRTEECTLLAGTYGIEYRWPLLDVRLIQAFLSIPSCEKYYRGIGRYLHKRAIVDIVPKNIVDQHSKYMGERMVQAIPKKMALNQDLHPALLMLIDQPKLFEQEKQLTDLFAQNSPKLHDVELMPARQNIQRVNALDNWLKHYFAKHCDWASMPERL